jgi:hypothetical protein
MSKSGNPYQAICGTEGHVPANRRCDEPLDDKNGKLGQPSLFPRRVRDLGDVKEVFAMFAKGVDKRTKIIRVWDRKGVLCLATHC